YNSPGLPPDRNIKQPEVQIFVRGIMSEYETTRTKAEAIQDLVHDLNPQYIDGVWYGGFVPVTDLIEIGRDSKERPMFTMNFRTIKNR
ncbi:MAG: minor capsid protein, partial [Bacteroidales bacterium]